MALHLKRILIIFATLMVIMEISKGQDDPANESEEEDDSSSEETVEDSNESRRRKRRSLEASMEGAGSADENNSKASAIPGLPELPAIPGLPDPQTILKIAEILTTVGQQVLPVLVSGNPAVSEFIANRATRDRKFLTNLKNEVNLLSNTLKNRK